MRIPGNGQVAFEQGLRERQGLLPGTEGRFVDDGDAVRLVQVEGEHRRGRSLVERMQARARARLTKDPIMALARGDG